MTQDQGLSSLLGRVEACVGADRELDCALAVAVGGFFIRGADPRERPLYCLAREDGTEVWPGQAADMLVPVYTASLDSALALCTRVLPKTSVAVKQWASGTGDAEIGGAGVSDTSRARAKTPALALIAALLKALISQSSESGDRASVAESALTLHGANTETEGH